MPEREPAGPQFAFETLLGRAFDELDLVAAEPTKHDVEGSQEYQADDRDGDVERRVVESSCCEKREDERQIRYRNVGKRQIRGFRISRQLREQERSFLECDERSADRNPTP